MPYIPQATRKRIAKTKIPTSAGELNYSFTLLYIQAESIKGDTVYDTMDKRKKFLFKEMTKFIKAFLKSKGESDYQVYNDIAGALSLSIEELNRRKAKGVDGNHVLWHDCMCASLDVLKWLTESTVNSYEDLKIKENGDVY